MTYPEKNSKIQLVGDVLKESGIPAGSHGIILSVDTKEKRAFVLWENRMTTAIDLETVEFRLLDRTPKLEHLEGCPACGCHDPDYLALDISGQVVHCDVCGWVKPEQ